MVRCYTRQKRCRCPFHEVDLANRIVRYEFMGSWLFFWLLCITVFGLPVALLYPLNGTIRIEKEMDDPERFIERYRTGELTAK